VGIRDRLRAIGDWVGRNRDDLIRDGLIAVVLAGVGVGAAFWIASRQDQLARDLETASEIQENVRFVRQVAIDPQAAKPFRGLNLHGAYLARLDLGYESRHNPNNCAEFEEADLGDALLYGTDLTLANLTSAKLAGANLFIAHLANANLHGADLTNANLSSADLRGANLSVAILSGANLQEVCFDDKTLSPDGFTPPAPGSCRYSASI